MPSRHLLSAAIFCLTLPAFAAIPLTGDAVDSPVTATPAAGIPATGFEGPFAVKPAPKTPPAPKESDFAHLPNGDIRLGCITLHRQDRRISFPATVVMAADTAAQSERGGIIDVLIAHSKGRLYEAVFSTEAVPSQIQAMLILLGLNNGARLAKDGQKQGDLVDIDVEWMRKDGMTVVEPVENFLQDTRTKKSMARAGWVFTGTTVQEGMANADAEGNVVLSWSCGATILDTPDPAGERTNLFVVNPEHAQPPVKTPVRLIMTPHKKAAAPAVRTVPPASSKPATTPRGTKTP